MTETFFAPDPDPADTIIAHMERAALKQRAGFLRVQLGLSKGVPLTYADYVAQVEQVVGQPIHVRYASLSTLLRAFSIHNATGYTICLNRNRERYSHSIYMTAEVVRILEYPELYRCPIEYDTALTAIAAAQNVADLRAIDGVALQGYYSPDWELERTISGVAMYMHSRLITEEERRIAEAFDAWPTIDLIDGIVWLWRKVRRHPK